MDTVALKPQAPLGAWVKIAENTYELLVKGGSIIRYELPTEKVSGLNTSHVGPAVAMVFVPATQ